MSHIFSLPAATDSTARASYARRRVFRPSDAALAALLSDILRGMRIVADFFIIALAYVASASLLKNYTTVPMDMAPLLRFLPIALVLKGMTMWYFGVFRSSLRHVGIPDVLGLVYAMTSSSAILVIATRWASNNVTVPGAFLVLDGALATLALMTVHVAPRIYCSEKARRQQGSRKVVVIGGGDGGASILRQLLMEPHSPIRPVAVIDDDPAKTGTRICGVTVMGNLSRLRDVVSKHRVSEILICIPSATRQQMGRILGVCRQCGVPVKTLPSLADLVSHTVSLRDLQGVAIEDVLQRERVTPDVKLTKNLLGGKTVLVTGAGGSIGSELCLQIAAAEPKRLILLDKSENSLFYSHLAVLEKYPGVDAVPCLADITDAKLLRTIFARERPTLVFHAAAFKHVGMMQLHPEEAIRNNVLGTRNVAAMAAEFGIERFVNVSTDKAVNPSCYMGLSKKLAEMTVKRYGDLQSAKFLNVRFGNVAGSSGSVLRLFSDQISKGGPIRVTDPRATRFFMSIPEAVYLILCAAARGKSGETYIFDMGKPINIYQLARTMSLLSGYTPEEEVPIEFIGLRDGEKVHEELWEPWEHPQQTENPSLCVLKGRNPNPIDVASALQRFEELLAEQEREQLVSYIDELLPAFAENRIPHFRVNDYSTPVAGNGVPV
jgi:FlaA1/EpsC-like NDP-sugar epimerase